MAEFSDLYTEKCVYLGACKKMGVLGGGACVCPI